MTGDRSFPLLDDEDLKTRRIGHEVGASAITELPGRRTTRSGRIIVALALLVSRLREAGAPEDLLEALEATRRRRNDAGMATNATIGQATIRMDAAAPAIEPEEIDPLAMDPTRDPVLARLLAHHGARRPPPIAGGVLGRWRGEGAAQGPLARYVDLPPDLKPFTFRASRERPADYEASIVFNGGEVVYEAGLCTVIRIIRPLPQTIANALEGREVRGVFDHACFEGMVFDGWAFHDGTPGEYPIIEA